MPLDSVVPDPPQDVRSGSGLLTRLQLVLPGSDLAWSGVVDGVGSWGSICNKSGSDTMHPVD